MKKRPPLLKALLPLLLFPFLFFAPLQGELQGESDWHCQSLHPSDNLQFGKLWKQIKRLENQGLLYPMIAERKKEILETKIHWKEKLSLKTPSPYHQEMTLLLKEGTLTGASRGCGSAYFLCDRAGTPRFVIKPFDEGVLCLNHPKHFASPFSNSAFRVRDEIPLYRSAQSEALSFEVAALLGLDHLTPSTFLTVIPHDGFFDISQRLSMEEDSNLLEILGRPDREKLCSVQLYLPNIDNLYHLVEKWLSLGYSEERILMMIDQEDFENLLFFIWILYDTDAHAGNLYCQKDRKGVYHILKLDNGLTFPTQNRHLLNALYFFPHCKADLSDRLREKIRQIPSTQIEEKLAEYEMEDSLEAFQERTELLRKLAEEKRITLREIDARLRALQSSR